MVNVSNALVGILNFVVFLLSIPILAAGIWLSHKTGSDCEHFLDKPLITLGVFLLLISIAGVVGACCKNSLLLWIYLIVVFVLLWVVLAFTIFAFVVTNKGAGQVVSSRGYKEYRLGDYSNWLQTRMNKNWNGIRSCLQHAKVCQSMVDQVNQQAAQFYSENLSPIQSGCCKPPTSCNYKYVSPTNWTTTSTNSTDLDCLTWSNDTDNLCYDCNACKAGVADNLKHDWKKVAVVNIIFLLFLLIVYSVGCCALRNN